MTDPLEELCRREFPSTLDVDNTNYWNLDSYCYEEGEANFGYELFPDRTVSICVFGRIDGKRFVPRYISLLFHDDPDEGYGEEIEVEDGELAQKRTCVLKDDKANFTYNQTPRLDALLNAYRKLPPPVQQMLEPVYRGDRLPADQIIAYQHYDFVSELFKPQIDAIRKRAKSGELTKEEAQKQIKKILGQF